MNYNFDKIYDSLFLDLDEARSDIIAHGEEHLDADKSLYVYDFETVILKLFKDFFNKGVRFLIITKSGFKRAQVIEILNNENSKKDLNTRALLVIKTEDGEILKLKLEGLNIDDYRDGSKIVDITVTRAR